MHAFSHQSALPDMSSHRDKNITPDECLPVTHGHHVLSSVTTEGVSVPPRPLKESKERAANAAVRPICGRVGGGG